MTDTVVETPAVAEEAKPVREKKVVVATPCACQFYTGKNLKGETLATGCEGETIRTFLPGHDAKLKSLILETAKAGETVVKATDEDDVEMEPLHAAEEFGFRALVEKSLDGFAKKQAVRDAKAKERAAKKEAADKKKADAKAKREADAASKKAHAEAVEKAAEARKSQPGPATAKVGRNKFDGQILADGTFSYKDAKGEDAEATEYTVVIDPATVPVPTVDAN